MTSPFERPPLPDAVTTKDAWGGEHPVQPHYIPGLRITKMLARFGAVAGAPVQDALGSLARTVTRAARDSIREGQDKTSRKARRRKDKDGSPATPAPGLSRESSVRELIRQRAAAGSIEAAELRASALAVFRNPDCAPLVRDLCAFATRDGELLSEDEVYDIAFTGNPGESYAIAFEVARANHFFSAAGSFGASAVDQLLAAIGTAVSPTKSG